ncbi:predicted protein [Chaetoceros tenuissimus]|uniref:Uncharacterized protein n=1 Tax=Chaetoceros tenuissimus TaxID=426638 RepID=A0AAD3D2R2_9STRA|nr:predicted protein [Chaetoceros tenuissimus]
MSMLEKIRNVKNAISNAEERIRLKKSIVSRIEETIVPVLDEDKWVDVDFLDDVEEFLNGKFLSSEKKMNRIVANALFRLDETEPDVEAVTNVIKAFPDALRVVDEDRMRPIDHLLWNTYGHDDFVLKYFLPLALEGTEYDYKDSEVLHEEKRGRGIHVRNKDGHTILQLLCRRAGEGADEIYLKILKELHRHHLFHDDHILYYELLDCSLSTTAFEFLVQINPKLLRENFDGFLREISFDERWNGFNPTFLHHIINNYSYYTDVIQRCFKLSLKYDKNILFHKNQTKDDTAFGLALKVLGENRTMSILREILTKKAGHLLLHQVIIHEPDYYNLCLSWFPDLLFLKDDEGQTAFKRALEKFGEMKSMQNMRNSFADKAKYPILHQVVVHQPDHFNLFVTWFPWMLELRDEQGRSVIQVLLSSSTGRELLKKNPTIWVRMRTEELEEMDPTNSLQPFAAVAANTDGDLNLSYQMFRQHPSVMDSILEKKEKGNCRGNVSKKRKLDASDDNIIAAKKKEAIA